MHNNCEIITGQRLSMRTGSLNNSPYTFVSWESQQPSKQTHATLCNIRPQIIKRSLYQFTRPTRRLLLANPPGCIKMCHKHAKFALSVWLFLYVHSVYSAANIRQASSTRSNRNSLLDILQERISNRDSLIESRFISRRLPGQATSRGDDRTALQVGSIWGLQRMCEKPVNSN